ncbi:MAG: ParB N-terminal domain-containing protein [Deltaproteobacteria bacterium]|nr:ParB N-terminal domain-containing protein [Deltaproteobacteria bacterium]
MEERKYQEVGLIQIQTSPHNPRKHFELEELVASIKSKGVLEPILLRPVVTPIDELYETVGGAGARKSLLKKPVPEMRFEIVAGERRFRAACIVAEANGGIEHGTIPSMVQEMTDDEAFDVMTIENLQREDLTELEEARGFQIYLDRKGIDALPVLSERTGIDARYIRRRIAVLALPEEMLGKWEKGEIHYGHLEQLTRVQDPEKRESYFNTVAGRNLPVTWLKQQIANDAPALKSSLFPRTEAGCDQCAHNTTIQRKLFGAEISNTGGQCLSPSCFKQNQNNWLMAHWAEFREKKGYPTNGFRFQDSISWKDYQQIASNKNAKKDCLACDKLVTIITLDGGLYYAAYDKACIGDKKCHALNYEKPSPEETKKKEKKDDPNAPRVAWQGRHFREEHYKTRIPELVNALPAEDEKVLRITLLVLLETHDGAAQAFGRKFDPKNMVKGYADEKRYRVSEAAWPAIENLDAMGIRTILREMSLRILMDAGSTAAHTRRRVACHLGSDLAKEWRINQEYLDKKTIAEIRALAEKFGIFADPKAQKYLYETLNKKRGKFDTCKKAELVRIVLESGVDLAGKVPAEILAEVPA